MSSQTAQFISEEIAVVRSEDNGDPVSFRWNGRDLAIREIIAVWPDWGFPAGAPKRKTWRMRRHRNCFRVETSDGAVYEMYHDRGLTMSGGKWILHSRIK
ncbi:MAG: hypothetical protein GY841_03515 [FCB group bacterium]|nr:hypothetical protein [FCB group bacterium]